jgi:uncharacterized Zn finger protein
VMEVVTQRGEGLFPKPAEIKMKCSCPDWAGMCKHVAAVMYGIGARLDRQPELLFLLREIDHLELIASALDTTPVATGKKSRVKKTIAVDDLADVFGIEMAEAEPLTEVAEQAKANPAKPRATTSPKKTKQKPASTVVSVSKQTVPTKKTSQKDAKTKTKTKPADSRSDRVLSARAKSSSRRPAKKVVS